MRLINADILKKYMMDNGKDVERFQQYVDEQPAAYDLDKVVKKLTKELAGASEGMVEANQGMCGTLESKFYGQKCAYEKAIDIVKGGGIDG